MDLEMEEIDKPFPPEWVFTILWAVVIAILVVDFALMLL